LESSWRRESRAKWVKGDGGETLPEKRSEVVGHHITSFLPGASVGIEGGVEFGMKRKRKRLRDDATEALFTRSRSRVSNFAS
jgi:hypothetical protein